MDEEGQCLLYTNKQIDTNHVIEETIQTMPTESSLVTSSTNPQIVLITRLLWMLSHRLQSTSRLLLAHIGHVRIVRGTIYI